MTQGPTNPVYAVLILKRGDEPIVALESPDWDKCCTKWEQLHIQWTECAKELKPFILKEPVVTAFEPGLIYEITIRPIMSEEFHSSKNHNPYFNEMAKNGFSSTMSRYTQGVDLLQMNQENQY